MIYYK